MRASLLGFLFIAVATAQDTEQQGILQENAEKDPELYVFDDNGNLVKLEYNENALSPVSVLPSNDTIVGERSLLHPVRFHLHSRSSLSEQELFVDNEESLKASTFDPKLDTMFITHGWINSRFSPACTLIKDAYLSRGNYNVIVVDWSTISWTEYIFAASEVPRVADRVSEMIDFLVKHGMNLKTTTMVGHSLGAHVTGLSANKANGTVNYVVGLDPARPGFFSSKPGERISKEDAKYVEIIHSNAGLLGFDIPIGVADFYPNGGRKQPGCIVDIGGSCSHSRSYELFAESLVSETGFYGRQCSDPSSIDSAECKGRLGRMGGPKHCLRFNGAYYVPTRPIPPFAMGAKLP